MTKDDFDIEALLFGTKKCSHCGHELPASSDFFGRDKYEKDGLKRQCKECTSAWERRRYARKVNKGGRW